MLSPRTVAVTLGLGEREPPSTKSITLADISRRETNAFSQLGQRRWDTRWSHNFNVKRFLRMLSSHFKDGMMKYPSYDVYIREYFGFHYLVEHFRLSCWRAVVSAPGSGYSIPHRTSTQMLMRPNNWKCYKRFLSVTTTVTTQKRTQASSIEPIVLHQSALQVTRCVRCTQNMVR